MHRFEEIQYLREALSLSPDNIPLLRFLIRKMREVPESYQDLEPFVERMMPLATFPDTIELNETLIDIYFHQNKLMACIRIWNEINDIYALCPGTMVRLSKCYLRLGYTEEARNMFYEFIELWPGILDRELEAFFRTPIEKFP